MTLPCVATGTSMVACLWIESLLLLAVWSDGGGGGELSRTIFRVVAQARVS